ncbi:predicted protein [Sclerotinia sclerotiorum 1980 UF-70]|uniref:Uncharacterized protein n=1 Tax=Sclerotinia sclerotiorum (strain ATCC 18683 / 1980 / Ss-1) TaxID=665079 RepID=A7EF24_SCLS1|nr:predicted protein [Sclerotinia sclerotiorum 1980 UF-70]EDO01440.1 predicted protein [Sclerotinia sclerotiorum 1980 UF-70]
MTGLFSLKRDPNEAGAFDVSQGPAENTQKKQQEEYNRKKAVIHNEIPGIVTSSPVRSTQSSLHPEHDDKGSPEKINDTTDKWDIVRLSLMEAYLFGCANLLAFPEITEELATVQHDTKGNHTETSVTSVRTTTDGPIDDTAIYTSTLCAKCSGERAPFQKVDIDEKPTQHASN